MRDINPNPNLRVGLTGRGEYRPQHALNLSGFATLADQGEGRVKSLWPSQAFSLNDAVVG